MWHTRENAREVTGLPPPVDPPGALQATVPQLMGQYEGNDWIRHRLTRGEPFAVGKMGSVEIQALVAPDPLPQRVQELLYVNAGVFPPHDAHTLQEFRRLFRAAVHKLTGIAQWTGLIGFPHVTVAERKMVEQMLADRPTTAVLRLRSLEPYYHPTTPWVQGLVGRRVLVVTPFPRSVEHQLGRMAEVWAKHPEMAASMQEVAKTTKAMLSPRSPAVFPPQEGSPSSWMEALDDTKRRMDEQEEEYDVALVGCGAYSLPLAVHAMERGRVGIHLGGPLQILFGIKGGRWDTHTVIAPLFTDAWIRPLSEECSPNQHLVESGCYW